MSKTDPFKSLRRFEPSRKQASSALYYSLPSLEEQGLGQISRLPFSIRVILESLLRNCDDKKVHRKDVCSLAAWNSKAQNCEEIPFIVARIVLQDFTGVPLLVDLAAMRSSVARLGLNPKIIEPLVPVDLVVDHSLQVDSYGWANAMKLNLDLEFHRNRERYEFLKWGQHAFKTFGVVPPGIGIVHQVNLEYLARGVLNSEGIYYPDTLVGTDSHTTMINGLGIVGWGVGGIEAEAGMLGQPIYFLTPEVVGVHLTGKLSEGVTATDLALRITEMLRAAKVVGKFVEFYGEGAESLPLPDRATIANMAPEYGATLGIFPVDSESVEFLRATGRTEVECEAFENYFKIQKMFGMPRKGQIDYSVDLELDLTMVLPSVAGPKRPQDRVELFKIKNLFHELLTKAIVDGGYGKNDTDLESHAFVARRNVTIPAKVSTPLNTHLTDSKKNAFQEQESRRDQKQQEQSTIRHGSVLIAAITSCTNTSNPSVMIAAGLLAKKAIEAGLSMDPAIKTSLGPGSRVVSAYLEKTGLQHYFDQLGFQNVGYGCTTCIGNSGALSYEVETALMDHDLVAVAVLSGNRNFEARIHQSIKANFLMSPPLVVAFALAGRIDIDFSQEAVGVGKDGKKIFLKDIWPTLEEIRDTIHSALTPEMFTKVYKDIALKNPKWNEIRSSTGAIYDWDTKSTYIQEPPFFDNFSMEIRAITPIVGARLLGIFGDSVTTDHISPAGAIKENSPAACFLIEKGVLKEDFNSYGSRRGNDKIMTRGTFANVRIKNLMLPGIEGGETLHQPDGQRMSIFDASRKYKEEKIPLIIIAGQEYGTGSSRDWAAKGTHLLGVKAVIAISYERIHRSNLVGMGILPLQFDEGTTAQTLRLDGSETYDIIGLGDNLLPRQKLILRIMRKNSMQQDVPIIVRIDTPIEVDYYRHGGILPFILRQIINNEKQALEKIKS